MGDDRPNRVIDRRTIEIVGTRAIRYREASLGMTPDQIRSAVAEVGPEVGKVRDYLWK